MDPLLRISPNIDINGLNSAVEGSANEIKGAITSLSQTIPTVATSLAGPELITNSFRTLINRTVNAPPWTNVLEPYATVNYIWTL